MRQNSTLQKSYDFSQSKNNPYIKALKRQITIRLDEETVGYFKRLAGGSGMPYQSLMNLYLRDCAQHQRQFYFTWR